MKPTPSRTHAFYAELAKLLEAGFGIREAARVMAEHKLPADQAAVLDRSVGDPADWSYLDEARNTGIPDLHASGQPMGALGFVHADLQEEVDLLPVMRGWLVGKESITVGTELWFPRLSLEGFD